MDYYIGTILPIAFTFAPEGWLMTRGQLVSQGQYQALYTLIGDIYGLSQNNTFALPNLQGRSLVGASIQDPDYDLGKAAGASQVALEPANMPMHTHAAFFTPILGNAFAQIPAQGGNLTVTPQLQVSSAPGIHQAAAAGDMLGASSNPIARNYTSTSTNPVTLTGLSAQVAGAAATPEMTAIVPGVVVGGTVAVKPAGELQPTPVDVRTPYLAINFMLCIQGLYPVRPS